MSSTQTVPSGDGDKLILSIRMPAGSGVVLARFIECLEDLEIDQFAGDFILHIHTPASALPLVHIAVSAFAANLDRLRIESGWSFDDLVEATGISKKLSIGHVRHGKGATPRNLKLYADAFAKTLHRPVTVQDVSGPAA